MGKSAGVKKRSKSVYISKTNDDWLKKKKDEGKVISESQGVDASVTVLRLIEEKSPAVVKALGVEIKE